VGDPEYYVRESACFALGQFSEHCQPEILYHHQAILPVIFQSLIDERPTVQGTSCYVLENFCENLQPHTLQPFLPQLMERLGQVLSNRNKITQEMALAAIAATAVASEHHFLPYAEV
jgi:importin-4